MSSSPATFALFALILLPVLLAAGWTWLQAVAANRELHALDGFEGMHFND